MTKVTYLTIYRNKCENYKVSYWHMSFHAAVPGQKGIYLEFGSPNLNQLNITRTQPFPGQEMVTFCKVDISLADLIAEAKSFLKGKSWNITDTASGCNCQTFCYHLSKSFMVKQCQDLVFNSMNQSKVKSLLEFMGQNMMQQNKQYC